MHTLQPSPSETGLQVKMWMRNSGFCFVTFSEHSGPVTGVVFLPNSAAVVSSSLDGTVRAYDLIRYRNFRTMTAPTPQQFSCVAVDPSGEVSAPMPDNAERLPCVLDKASTTCRRWWWPVQSTNFRFSCGP